MPEIGANPSSLEATTRDAPTDADMAGAHAEADEALGTLDGAAAAEGAADDEAEEEKPTAILTFAE